MTMKPPLPVTKARVAPLYQQVHTQLRDLILNGIWPSGTLVPGENELASQFGVAVGTIRRALSALKEDGMLVRQPRKGTFVTGRMPQHNLRQFFHFFRLQGANGETYRSVARVLDCQRRAAAAQEAQALQIEAGEEVIALRRVRSVGGRAVMYETFVMQASRVPDFPMGEVPPLLYQFLWDRYDIRIHAVRERVTADIVNEEDRRMLDLDGAKAVLVIDDAAFDQAGAPVLIATHRCITQGMYYINEVQ